ncbi:hypothetical protein RFI_22552 [Reticulomyxa filosa]|uniref:Uncharacterized protein n=1 Tax=Reticulomyxa filosa TaxID=46433 RepID=X6MME7_RETFI|nr:hypothetical protein RFI_22552 [Reticulomyxa filosa]|eukprot:ETO14816.1 hypothetical protein RFI_22552 [Reticulomyxa filosa]
MESKEEKEKERKLKEQERSKTVSADQLKMVTLEELDQDKKSGKISKMTHYVILSTDSQSQGSSTSEYWVCGSNLAGFCPLTQVKEFNNNEPNAATKEYQINEDSRHNRGQLVRCLRDEQTKPDREKFYLHMLMSCSQSILRNLCLNNQLFRKTLNKHNDDTGGHEDGSTLKRVPVPVHGQCTSVGYDYNYGRGNIDDEAQIKAVPFE